MYDAPCDHVRILTIISTAKKNYFISAGFADSDFAEWS